jgi:peptidyl-prolyl cis-trans isomerase SurA
LKRNFSLGVLIGVWMLFFTATATASAASEVLDRIVAVVNEDIILLSELNERMAPYAQRIRQQGFDLDKERQMLFKVREEMLNRLVDEKLTDQEIKRNDIQVDEAEIDSTIERIKAANSFTDEDLRRFLEQDQMTMEQYRKKIKEQVLRTRLVNYQVKSKIVITEEEIRAYYDSHPELYGGKTPLPFEKHPDAGTGFCHRCRKAGRSASRCNRSNPRSSPGNPLPIWPEGIARGPTAADGGDIGEFSKETLSPAIQAALEGLTPGQATAVVATDQGFQLFYVEAIHQTEGKSLESVREEIHQKLFAEVVDKKFLSWLEDLRSQSHIKIIN